ncbi:MAG: hypothetical protein ACFBSD_15325 [Paracoccaceae bacterium]
MHIGHASLYALEGFDEHLRPSPFNPSPFNPSPFNPSPFTLSPGLGRFACPMRPEPAAPAT